MDKRKLAVVVSGLALVGGLSAGAALAQSSGSAPATSVQETSPDVAGKAEPNEQAEGKEGVEQEIRGPEEPGDEQLPGGGHADPEGQNVDHQFEGVE